MTFERVDEMIEALGDMNLKNPPSKEEAENIKRLYKVLPMLSTIAKEGIKIRETYAGELTRDDAYHGIYLGAELKETEN